MSSSPKYQAQIEKRIDDFSCGMAFSSTDFADISNRSAANQALSRIEKSGKIRRIIKGIYDKPAYSRIIQEYGVPRIDEVANALARRYCWQIVSAGDMSLNILHISTQVPNVWEYASSGPSREYLVDKTPLKFKHIPSNEIVGLSEITAMVIQAIHAIGKGKITGKQIQLFADVLSETDKKKLIEETRNVPNWIYEEIKLICTH